jgi:hypothetical protein
MIKEESSKAWIVVIVAIIGATGVICAAIIALGVPFAERYADIYFSSLNSLSTNRRNNSQCSKSHAMNESRYIFGSVGCEFDSCLGRLFFNYFPQSTSSFVRA